MTSKGQSQFWLQVRGNFWPGWVMSYINWCVLMRHMHWHPFCVSISNWLKLTDKIRLLTPDDFMRCQWQNVEPVSSRTASVIIILTKLDWSNEYRGMRSISTILIGIVEMLLMSTNFWSPLTYGEATKWPNLWSQNPRSDTYCCTHRWSHCSCEF